MTTPAPEAAQVRLLSQETPSRRAGTISRGGCRFRHHPWLGDDDVEGDVVGQQTERLQPRPILGDGEWLGLAWRERPVAHPLPQFSRKHRPSHP